MIRFAIISLFLSSSVAQSCEKAGTCATDDECFIYLAPSSIPNAGLGVYSTIPLKEGDPMLSFDHSPSLSVMDIDKVPGSDDWESFFTPYTWGNPTDTSQESLFEADNVMDFQPGMGCFTNTHPYLKNVDIEMLNDSTYNADVAGPGFGAYTQIVGRAYRAAQDINAGDELFLDYGDAFFEGRDDLADAPRSADYIEAGKIIQSIFKNGRKVTDNSLDLLREALFATKHRVASLLPKNVEELKQITADVTVNNATWPVAVSRNAVIKRDVQWIKENGICLDNIKIGESKIPHAGRGAIARRNIPKGNVIVPMPMIQMNDPTLLQTHEVTARSDGTFVHNPNLSGKQQLFVNYLFGHPQTPLLLLPTTNAILVNHCSDKCQKPNAKLAWSEDETTSQWLKMSLDEISRQFTRGLALDLVATENINAGDEIFIDYGKRWADAWDDHLKAWNDDQPPLKSMKEGDRFTGCYYWNKNEYSNNDRLEKEESWWRLDDTTLLSLYSSDGSNFTLENGEDVHAFYWPCTILDSSDSESTLTVRIFDFDLDWQHSEKKRPIFLTNYPVSSIKNFYKPYSSPSHSSFAFRHYIGIPSEMLPQQWLQTDSGNPHDIEHPYQPGDKVEVHVKSQWTLGTIFSCSGVCVKLDRFDTTERNVDIDRVRFPTKTIIAQTEAHPFY